MAFLNLRKIIDTTCGLLPSKEGGFLLTLLLHKVFNTKRNLKSKIKKKSIFVSQRNSEIKKII